jgi:hypothetical protein
MTLIGRYLGREIVFNLVNQFGGKWLFKAAIPAVDSGTVILELYATDDAGNVGTRVESVVMIDFDSLSVKVLWNDFRAVAQKEKKYHSKLVVSDYRVVVL